MELLELDQDRLLHFREAHETRRNGLRTRSQKLLNMAAEMYENLGCLFNAEMTRDSLSRLPQIQYMESDRRRG